MKSKVIFTFISFIVLFVINKTMLFSDLKKQFDLAEVLNTSGKQRMYSQKITKLSFYTNGKIESGYIDFGLENLKKTVNGFATAQQYLKESHLSNYNNYILDELFIEIDPYFLAIVNSAEKYFKNPNDIKTRNYFIETVKSNESQFLKIMDEIVGKYQEIAERNATVIKYREITFNVIILFLIIYGTIAIIIPLLKDEYKSIE